MKHVKMFVFLIWYSNKTNNEKCKEMMIYEHIIIAMITDDGENAEDDDEVNDDNNDKTKVRVCRGK